MPYDYKAKVIRKPSGKWGWIFENILGDKAESQKEYNTYEGAQYALNRYLSRRFQKDNK